MSRRIFTVLAAAGAAILIAFTLAANAGNLVSHPVIGWGGNQFLFVVKPEGDHIRLTAYRAAGSMWQRYGTTTIRRGQKAPEHGFVQDIWFKGKRIGSLEADMNNPFWRAYPGDDRDGTSWP